MQRLYATTDATTDATTGNHNGRNRRTQRRAITHAHYARVTPPKYLIRPMHHFPQWERQTNQYQSGDTGHTDKHHKKFIQISNLTA